VGNKKGENTSRLVPSVRRNQKHVLVGNLLRMPATSSLRVAKQKSNKISSKHYSVFWIFFTKIFSLFKSTSIDIGCCWHV